MHHHTELSFVNKFRWVSPLQYKKTDDRTLFFFGACCKQGRHLYTTTAPSCCIPASYFHLSATLQTMSITAVTLQDNGAVFRICIALFKVFIWLSLVIYFPLVYSILLYCKISYGLIKIIELACTFSMFLWIENKNIFVLTTKSISERIYWDTKGRITNLLNRFLHENLHLQPIIILIILFLHSEYSYTMGWVSPKR